MQDYDIKIGDSGDDSDNLYLRLYRGENVTPYRYSLERRQIPINTDPASGLREFSSREELGSFFQSSWAGGSTWWKPAVFRDVDTYFLSNNVDTWRTPGLIEPLSDWELAAKTNLSPNVFLVSDGSDVYALGSTNTVNASYLDVYKWTPSTENLSANESSIETSTAGWSADNATLTRSASFAKDGTYSLWCQASTTGDSGATLAAFQTGITAGEKYRAEGWVYNDSGVDGTCRIDILWYTSGDTLISTTTGASFDVDDAIGFEQVYVSGRAPATAAKAKMKLVAESVAQFADYYWDLMGFQDQAWVAESYTSGVGTTDVIANVVYNASDGFFYVLAYGPGADWEIHRFNSAGFTHDIISNSAASDTANAIMVVRGNIWVMWDGIIQQLDDPGGTPALTTITDDGMGVDFLTGFPASGNIITPSVGTRLAISTAEGVYYVKNVNSNGVVTPWVFRIERDAGGNWNSTPIATGMAGEVILSMGYLLGSVIMIGSSAVEAVINNDSLTTGHWATNIYHITGGNLGMLGQPLGGDTVDESIYRVVGADAQYLYLSGNQRLWVYDAVRGGLHSAHEWESGGIAYSMASIKDVDDRTGTLFGGASLTEVLWDRGQALELYTSGSKYTLESNYLTYGFPTEFKQIVAWSIYNSPTPSVSGPRWTISLSIDDGQWLQIGFTSIVALGNVFTKATLPEQTYSGFKYRYKLEYTTPNADETMQLKDFYLAGNLGRNVETYDLMIDLQESLNINNQVRSAPELMNLIKNRFGQGASTYEVTDFWEHYDKTPQVTYFAADSRLMRFESLTLEQTQPGEAVARLVLTSISDS